MIGTTGFPGWSVCRQPLEIDRTFARQIAGQPRHRLWARALRDRARRGAPAAATSARRFSRPPSRKNRSNVSSSGGGSVEAAASRASSRSSPGNTASAMPRARASDDRRSIPYFHQSRPPSRRTTITLAWAPTRSIHRSTDIGWRRSRRWASRTLGSAARSDLPRGGKAGEVAVGERQHGDVARRLAEIDRFDDLVEAG